jgi:hypothetical protein
VVDKDIDCKGVAAIFGSLVQTVPLYPIRGTGKRVEDVENKVVVGALWGGIVRKLLYMKAFHELHVRVGVAVNGCGYGEKFT